MDNYEKQASYFDQPIIDYKDIDNRLKENFPQMVKGYFEFTEACFSEGVMSLKDKQLIALGISIYAQDEYSIMYHTKGAIDHGSTKDELMETIAVSAALSGGAVFSQGIALAIDTFDHYRGQA